VGVRADDEREAAVEVMREGLFLAGCLGVEVADRDVAGDPQRGRWRARAPPRRRDRRG